MMLTERRSLVWIVAILVPDGLAPRYSDGHSENVLASVSWLARLRDCGLDYGLEGV
jgi:hypothetical protein